MRVLGSRQFAILTLGMSLPLLFSFQLKTPPTFLQGLPFIMIWTRGVVSAITVPFLTGLHVSEKKRSLMEATNQMQKRPPRLKLLQGPTLASASLHHDVALGRLRMIGR